MRNLERRLRKLEAARNPDPSGYPRHSPEWLAFWDRELYAYATGEPHVPLTQEGVRAIVQAWGLRDFL